MAGLVAFDRNRKGDVLMRNVGLGAIALAVLFSLTAFSPAYELLSRL